MCMCFQTKHKSKLAIVCTRLEAAIVIVQYIYKKNNLFYVVVFPKWIHARVLMLSVIAEAPRRPKASVILHQDIEVKLQSRDLTQTKWVNWRNLLRKEKKKISFICRCLRTRLATCWSVWLPSACSSCRWRTFDEFLLLNKNKNMSLSGTRSQPWQQRQQQQQQSPPPEVDVKRSPLRSAWHSGRSWISVKQTAR